MPPETEVITCPACRHLVRVPVDWLGQTVQCPECKATFKAPIKVDGRLTEAELISRPTPAAPKPAKRLDYMLLLPAFGLMFLGVVGSIVNGYHVSGLYGPDGGVGWVKTEAEKIRPVLSAAEAQNPGPPEAQAQQDEEIERRLRSFFRWFIPLSFLESLIVFLGGLSITLRWNYRLAQLGCVLAMINIANGCCLPGVIAGLWGMLMLNSEEARGHFGR
jgi:hypothetical protein